MAKRFTMPAASGASITASGNTASSVLPNDGGIVEALIQVTAVTGTTPSLTPKLQVSLDGATWFDATTGAAITTAGAQRLQCLTLAAYARVAYTVSGTTPNFTATINVLAN